MLLLGPTLLNLSGKLESLDSNGVKLIARCRNPGGGGQKEKGEEEDVVQGEEEDLEATGALRGCKGVARGFPNPAQPLGKLGTCLGPRAQGGLAV